MLNFYWSFILSISYDRTMTSKNIILQDYVSRPQSLRYQLSCHTYTDGLDTFFSHCIPFSYSTSMELAERYALLIEAYDNDSPLKENKIVECGAGLGILTYHICEILAKRNPKLFAKTSFIITDSSLDLVKTMSHHPLYMTYKDHVSWQIFDCLSDDFSFLNDASVVIMNYLCDSLKTHHLEFKSDTLHEWQVQTYVNDSDYFFDTTVFPPHFMQSTELQAYFKRFLSKTNHKQPPTSLARISKLLKENWKKFPITHHLSSDQCDLIAQFITTSKMTDPQRFNFSFDLDRMIQSLLTHVPKQCLILIYDFGFTSWATRLRSKKHFLSEFGMNQFFSVTFAQILYRAKSMQFQNKITSFTYGDSQCLMLYRSQQDQQLTQAFQTLFNVPGYDTQTNFIPNILKNHSKNSQHPVSQEIKSQFKKLTSIQSSSYYLLTSISDYLIAHDTFEEALYYIERLKTHYGPFARTGFYHQLKGLNKAQRYQECIHLVQTNQLETCQHSGIIYEYLLAICYSNKFLLFQKTFEHFLTLTDYFIPWRFFLISIAIFENQHNKDTAKKLRLWLKNINQEFPSLLPDSAKEAFFD